MLVRVGQDFCEARDDGREGDGKLLGGQERHGAHELDRSLLRSPLLVVQTG